MATRKELIEALRARYRSAAQTEKTKILDEFIALTGYHRKHAIRVLREDATRTATRARNRLYDEAVRQALTVLWEAADRVCGKRLKASIPMLERQAHPEHAYRACLGLLALDRRYGDARLEVACAMAVELGTSKYATSWPTAATSLRTLLPRSGAARPTPTCAGPRTTKEDAGAFPPYTEHVKDTHQDDEHDPEPAARVAPGDHGAGAGAATGHRRDGCHEFRGAPRLAGGQ